MADDLTPAPTMPDGLPTGTVLGDTYEIIKQIALGGMAEVYKAKNVHTDEPVAVKVVLPEFARDQTITALFKKEATILSRLHTEAIVHYHAFSVDRDLKRPYLVMEFVDGTPLSDVIRNTPMAPSRVRQLMVRIALGLSAAHELGVVHRDLSPDNVILPDGDVSKTKIIDFGIAKATVGEGTLLGGKFAGKYNYVSPEQLGLYGGDVTERSDIYSLGLVLAAALLGKPLDMSGSHADVIDKRRVIPDLSGVDASLRPIISSMLEPEPERRPRNMRSIIDMFSSPPKMQDSTVFGGDMPVIAEDPWSAAPPPSRSIPPSSRSIPPGRSLPPQDFQDAPQGYQTTPPGYQDPPQGYQTTPPGYQDPQRYPDPQQGYQDPQRGRSIPPMPAERTSLSQAPGAAMPMQGGRGGPLPASVVGPAGADSPFGPFNPSGPAAALPPIGKNGKVIGAKKGGAPVGLMVGGLVALLVIGGGGYFAVSQHMFGGAAPAPQPAQVDIASAPQPTPAPAPTPTVDTPTPAPAPAPAPAPTASGGTGNLDGGAQSAPAPTPAPTPTPTPAAPAAPTPSSGADTTSTPVTQPPATPQPTPTPAPATPQSAAKPPPTDVASTGPVTPPTTPPADAAAGQLDTAAQRIAWLNSYAFDGCQYATATKVAANTMDIEAFGTTPSDFEAFSDSFEKQSGFAPHIAMRQINDIECPAVDFVDSTKSFAKPGLTLKLNDDTIAGGGDLRGTVSATPGWSTKLLLVDSLGYINNVSKYLSGTDNQTFDIPHLTLTSPDPVPMLIVAIASQGPLQSAAIDQTDYASTVFRKISKEISSQSLPVSVGLKYFQLGGTGKK